MKVYCKECKFSKPYGHYGIINCYHKSCFREGHYSLCDYRVYSDTIKNSHNNCKDFEQKFSLKNLFKRKIK